MATTSSGEWRSEMVVKSWMSVKRIVTSWRTARPASAWPDATILRTSSRGT